MQISLAQGIQLISQLNSEIQAKRIQRTDASEIVFQKGESYTLTDDVDKLSDELDVLYDRVRELKVKIGQKNVETKLDIFGGELDSITLAEALVLVQQIRNELEACEYLAQKNPNPQLQRAIYGGESCYSVANFDVNKYKRLASELRKRANRISTEIDRVNHNTMIDVSWADEYIA